MLFAREKKFLWANARHDDQKENVLRKILFEFIIGIMSLCRLFHHVATEKLQGRTADIIDDWQNIDGCFEDMQQLRENVHEYSM